MKQFLLLALFTISLSACGKSFQHRSGDNSNYKYDYDQCKAEAKAFVEKRNENRVIPTETVTRCKGTSDGYSFNANCVSSERKDSLAEFDAAMRDRATRQKLRNKCMEEKGYYK